MKIILRNKQTNEEMELEGNINTPPIGWEIVEKKKEKRSGPRKNANGDGSFYFSETLQKWVGQYDRKTITQRKNETKTECKQRWEKLKADIKGGSYIEKSNDTLYKILERRNNQKYKDGIIAGATYQRNKETLTAIQRCCRNFIDKPIQKVIIEDIEDAKPLIREYAPNTIDKIWGMLKAGFRVAHSRKKITFNIMEDDTLTKPISVKATKQVEALTIEEEQKLRDILSGEERNHPYRDISIVQLNTAMRIGEVLARRTTDLDVNKFNLKIDNTLTVDEHGETIIGEHTKVFDRKNGIDKGSRIFPLDIETRQILLNIKNSFLQNINNLFFWDYQNNTFVSHKEINSWLERINEKYKITTKSLSTHVLRHTKITRMQEAGIPLVVIQYLVGHVEGSKMTNDVYTSISLDFITKSLKEANML